MNSIAPPRHLIIGSDGLLGTSIARQLRQTNQPYCTTSRRSDPSHSGMFLDLSRDIHSFQVPEGIETAYLCAASTSIAWCRFHQYESRLINVTNTVRLAKRLTTAGIRTLFPSTNLVFDGEITQIKPDTPMNPAVEYGRQKAAAEKELLVFGKMAAVIRFSKIMSPADTLITDWIRELKKKETIRPFSDMVLAPVSLEFATAVLLAIADERLSGIWQVSADKDITYEELARYIAEKLGADYGLVQPVSVNHSGMEFERIPKNTTLDTGRIENELGLKPPEIWDTVDSIIAAHQ